MFDYVLVGGGLANGLVAMAVAARRPTARIAVVEAEARLGGNHTWSFHESDLSDEGLALVRPLVEARWPGVVVRFPDRERRLPSAYASATSGRLDAAVRAALRAPGSVVFDGARADRITGDRVWLSDGRIVEGRVVIDARGPAVPTHYETAGFQKFLGLEVEVEPSAAVPDAPVLMDATVAQTDGYRFMYVLPFSRTRLLLEDTYYADGPILDAEALRARIHAYAAGRGLTIRRVLREEAGVLPIPWAQDGAPPLGAPVRIGYQAGWFHPTTGYSLPVAARVATAIADAGPEGAAAALRPLWKELRAQARFCQLLNRLLFRAVTPAERWTVFSRFYGLPIGTIERFYASRMSSVDRARVLCGRPPRGVSLRSALFPSQAV